MDGGRLTTGFWLPWSFRLIFRLRRQRLLRIGTATVSRMGRTHAPIGRELPIRIRRSTDALQWSTRMAMGFLTGRMRVRRRQGQPTRILPRTVVRCRRIGTAMASRIQTMRVLMRRGQPTRIPPRTAVLCRPIGMVTASRTIRTLVQTRRDQLTPIHQRMVVRVHASRAARSRSPNGWNSRPARPS